MNRAWVVLGMGVAMCLAATQAAAGPMAMRHVDCLRLGQLPAMKLVVRSQEVLAKLGVGDLVQVDFAREMGLFVSLGADKDNLESIAIESVVEKDGKIVVAIKKIGFQEMLAATGATTFRSYQFVAVPASKLPVDGFVEDVEPCAGLCVTSNLTLIEGEVTWSSFHERGDSRGWTTKRVDAPNPMILKFEYMDSVAWDIGPAEDPKGIRVRFFALKGGAGAQACYEYTRSRYAPPPPPLAGVSKAERAAWTATKAPVQRDLLIQGIAAAYKTPIANAEVAADQILYGYKAKTSETAGRCDVPAIRMSDLDAASFRKFIQSDGTTFTAESFIDSVDEVGKAGSIRWTKPYFKAEQEVEGLGKVTLAYNNLKLFQMKVEEVKTTNVDQLREHAQKMGRRLGLRLTEEQVKALQFSFGVAR